MSKKGDPEDQRTFDFVERVPARRRSRLDAISSSLAQVTADDRLASNSKRAQRRDRGKSREKQNSPRLVHVPTEPATPAKFSRGWWWGGASAIALLVTILVAPQQLSDAYNTYRKWLGIAKPTEESPNPEKPLPRVPQETGSIERDESAASIQNMGTLRERSISAAVELLGEGSYAVQLQKFNGYIKNHVVELPGWKALVLEANGAMDDARCVLLRDPQRVAAIVRACSVTTIANFRPKDCVRIIGKVIDYPPDQMLLIEGEMLAERSGCYSPKKRTAPSKTSGSWLDRLFVPQEERPAKP